MPCKLGAGGLEQIVEIKLTVGSRRRSEECGVGEGAFFGDWVVTGRLLSARSE